MSGPKKGCFPWHHSVSRLFGKYFSQGLWGFFLLGTQDFKNFWSTNDVDIVFSLLCLYKPIILYSFLATSFYQSVFSSRQCRGMTCQETSKPEARKKTCLLSMIFGGLIGMLIIVFYMVYIYMVFYYDSQRTGQYKSRICPKQPPFFSHWSPQKRNNNIT